MQKHSVNCKVLKRCFKSWRKNFEGIYSSVKTLCVFREKRVDLTFVSRMGPGALMEGIVLLSCRHFCFCPCPACKGELFCSVCVILVGLQDCCSVLLSDTGREAVNLHMHTFVVWSKFSSTVTDFTCFICSRSFTQVQNLSYEASKEVSLHNQRICEDNHGVDVVKHWYFN